jgi:hypothetical protein
MEFHDTYLASGSSHEELQWLLATYRFDNPGPIVAYPPNAGHFPQGVCPATLPGNRELLIPWHPIQLQRTVVFFTKLAHAYAKQARGLIGAESSLQAGIAGKLAAIDGLSAAFTATVSAFSAGATRLTASQLAKMGEDAAVLAGYVAADRAPAVLGQVSQAIAPPHLPSTYSLRFLNRHAFGAWSPSFWSSVYVAIAERDMSSWLYGPAATEYARKQQIRAEFDRDIARLTAAARGAAERLSEPFYVHRL